MTKDEIIEMARYIADTFGTRMCDENGDTHGEELYAMSMDDIVESIKLAAAKEREACALIGDGYHDDEANCGDLIRLRGKA